MQAFVQQFAEARLADWQVVQSYVGTLLEKKALVAPDDAQTTALLTTLAVVLATNLVLMLLTPRGRKIVLDTLETVLATALIAVLLAIVLGLPLGIVYLVLKAVAFLLNLVLGIPAVAGLIDSLRSSVGL